MQSINCRGRILGLDEPKVMGVINLSSSSFYSGSVYKSIDEVACRVEGMINEGVDIIDIGGQTSRPGSVLASVEDELKVVLPVFELLKHKFPKQIFSIDTFYSKVAVECFNLGAHIVNDISGGTIDDKMIDVVIEYNMPYVCNHIIGIPQNMQLNLTKADIILEILNYFRKKTKYFDDRGFKDLIIDVGIGFGKSIEQNIELIKNLNIFKCFDKVLLIGISRKSFIFKMLNTKPEHSLHSTAIFNFIALQNGANIIRVHDVKEAKETIQIFKKFNSL